MHVTLKCLYFVFQYIVYSPYQLRKCRVKPEPNKAFSELHFLIRWCWCWGLCHGVTNDASAQITHPPLNFPQKSKLRIRCTKHNRAYVRFTTLQSSYAVTSPLDVQSFRLINRKRKKKGRHLYIRVHRVPVVRISVDQNTIHHKRGARPHQSLRARGSRWAKNGSDPV
jgi:hypothetical protein